MRTSFADHPRHAVAHRAQVLDVRADEGTSIERRTVAQPVPRGDDEPGCVGTWYISTNASSASFQFWEDGTRTTVQSARLHLPRAELQGSMHGRNAARRRRG